MHAKITTVAAAAMLLSAAGSRATQSPQVPLAGSAIPQFVEPLPRLSVQPGGTLPTLFGNRAITLSMCEFKANVLPVGTFLPGVKPATTVWGYVEGTTCPGPGAAPRDTYLGPVIVNVRGSPTTMTFVNQLGDATSTNLLAYKYSTDQTLHWADPLNGEANDCNMFGGIPAFNSLCAQNYSGPIPAVVHLHGGEVPPELDGGPDAWFTGDGLFRGHRFYSKVPGPGNQAIYAYPNRQEAAPIWFHDHTLGATRLNVYAGLAGGYYVVDPAQRLAANLPGVADVIPLIIQDRMFDTNGELFFPAAAAFAPNPEHPYWVPEFIGDTIAVNGKVWPFLEVQPKRYRFLFVNGSNARTYELFLKNRSDSTFGPPIWVIGTDGGLLDFPAKVDAAAGDKLLLMSGERYEAIIDFGGLAPGTVLRLRNSARAPYPGGIPVDGPTTARILEFRVVAGSGADTSYDPSSGHPIRLDGSRLQRLADPAAGTIAPGVPVALTRQLTLNEVLLPARTAIDPVTGNQTAYPGGPFEILVNNTKWSGESTRPYRDFVPITVGGVTTAYSELPKEGETEIWEIVNLTADAHPIHTHLTQFQLINRQTFRKRAYDAAYQAAFPAVPGDAVCTGGVFCPGFGPPLHYRTGNPSALGGNPDINAFLKDPPTAALPQEAGWKDTVMTLPGIVTRIAVRFAPTNLPAKTPAAKAAFAFDPTGGGDRGYVWHCHIADHEDNEMMRPDLVQLNNNFPAATRPLVKGVDY